MVPILHHLKSSIAGLLAILLISYYFLSKYRAANQHPKPPEAAGGWPLIGHLRLLGRSGDPPYITLGALADKYGPIFSIRFGVRPAVVVSSWELAKECFTTHDVIVSSRPKLTAFKILGYDYINFGFSPYGAFWREMRKITASELLSIRRLESLKNIRESELDGSLKELYRLWSIKKEDSSQSLLVEMKQWLGDINLNVILRMIVGKRYSGDAADDQEVRRCRRVFRDFFRLTGIFIVGDVLPFLGWFDLGGYVKDMKRVAKEIDSIMCEWLEEHQRKRESGEAKTEQDFIDVMSSVLEKADLEGYDADTVNKATCSTIIAGATDTTAVTMTWALSLLLNHRDVLKRVQDELDLQVGKQRLVNESDINNLVYLQATVKETLRLYAAGPLGGPREFTQDCILGGYHIKAGTRLMVNIWKLQRDKRVWSDDALEFKPERFLTSHKDVDVKGGNFELIPFGGGRRACPGIWFGLQMTYLALAALLQAFEVTTPSDAAVDMTASFGLTNIKATPLLVLVKPRLSPSLYQQ